SSGEIDLLFCTIAHHYYFVQCPGIFQHGNRQEALPLYRYFYRLISDIGNYQHIFLLDVQKGKMALKIRRAPLCRPFHHNIDANEWQSLAIRNCPIQGIHRNVWLSTVLQHKAAHTLFYFGDWFYGGFSNNPHHIAPDTPLKKLLPE